jgi:hypothetical protein
LTETSISHDVKARSKPLNELTAGDLLVRSVLTEDGKLLLNGGIRLSQNAIDRLHEISDLIAEDYLFAISDESF